MPVVFVHGNPETPAIWDDLVQHLDRKDVVTLSPPGFGARLPEGFSATSDDYVEWLAGELEKIDGPIDLVGHDWGGGHVMRLVMKHPEMVRSWVMDIAGCFDPRYVWHDFAQLWQTPGAGEEAIKQMQQLPLEARVAQFQGLGMSEAAAKSCAAAANEDMGKAILTLYRSAAQPAMKQWGEGLPKAKARPGLVIIATEDHFTGGEELARASAERAGAKVAVLEGLGHWWMCQDPKAGAAVLNEFFAGL
jgi:pimeloyl-ACP methyl ester carboxylesterase